MGAFAARGWKVRLICSARGFSNWIVLTAVCLVIGLPVLPAGKPCNAAELDEYSVKIAFIYNFAQFIEWPPEAFPDRKSPIVFCILGDDPFGSRIDAIGDKKIGERSFLVRRIKKVEEARRCHILFIGGSDKDRLDFILRSLKDPGILTISDFPNFTRMGGMIGFTLSGDKVRFEINLKAARKTKLEISSKLLKLAETVRDD